QAGSPPPEIVEPLLGLAGSLSRDRLNADVARSIGQPAGQGGRYAAWQYSALAGLVSAWERAKSPSSVEAYPPFAELLDSARRLVSADSGDEAERLAATSLLRHSAARNDGDRDRLAGLLRPRVSVALQ